jgi:hypothetical protein
MPRTVNIQIESDKFVEIAAEVGYDKLYEAIGYLSTWSIMGTGYDTVTIFHDRDLDLVAMYARNDGGQHYIIGAVWHEDHYGYHS